MQKNNEKIGTVALIVQKHDLGIPKFVDALSSEEEIRILEEALKKGAANPLEAIYQLRKRQSQEDEEFGD